MYIQNNSVNFTSRILPSEPLKNTFNKFSAEKDFLYRKRFVNYLDALVNDGKHDIIEIKKVESRKGKMIRGFVNGKDTTGLTIDESNRYRTQADCVVEVISRLTRRSNPIEKFKKLGIRRLQEIQEIIFNNK